MLLPHQQTPTGNWKYWLVLTRRAAGKTRAGAEFITECANSGSERLAVLGTSSHQVRDVMALGESGLVRLSQRIDYLPSRSQLVYRPEGDNPVCLVNMVSADNTRAMMGCRFDAAWIDELSIWPSDAMKTIKQLEYCCDGRIVITTGYPFGPQPAYDPEEPLSRFHGPKAYIDWLIERAKREDRIAVNII